MSRLAYFGRPFVAFDASNKEHRQWFYEFQTQKTWGRCPVRFLISDDGGDLVSLCQRRLVDFYSKTEFDIAGTQYPLAI